MLRTGVIDISIFVESVTKDFRKGHSVNRALADVHLEVQNGEAIAIMGPSGSGKTTLLYVMGMLLSPSSGRVILNGVDSAGLSDREKSLVRNRQIGFVFQSHNLVPSLNVADNIALPMKYAGVARGARTSRVCWLLDMVGLNDRATSLPLELSGGEEQRVAVARALANEPSIILADEPTGSLDSSNGRDILRLLRDANQLGATLVVVTHQNEVADECGRLVYLRDGALQ